MAKYTVTIPLRTVSTVNQREHWSKRAKRTAAERLVVHAMLPRIAWNRRAAVLLTRIAPRLLDDDNLRSALKAVRDQVAVEMGLDADNDSRVSWAYGQRKGGVREYAVEVQIA